jgi:DNA-binding Lrp family transcriptional regulator
MKAYLALNYKVDSYNRVIKELLDLGCPKNNIYNLFGPIDIIIKFNEVKSINEFVEKWLRPIQKIGLEKALITNTITSIVISEGPSFTEEPYAFIFLNIQPFNVENARKALLTIPEVLTAEGVLGSYDIICPVIARDRADLKRLTSYIRSNVPNVIETVTSVISVIRIGLS